MLAESWVGKTFIPAKRYMRANLTYFSSPSPACCPPALSPCLVPRRLEEEERRGVGSCWYWGSGWEGEEGSWGVVGGSLHGGAPDALPAHAGAGACVPHQWGQDLGEGIDHLFSFDTISARCFVGFVII